MYRIGVIVAASVGVTIGILMIPTVTVLWIAVSLILAFSFAVNPVWFLIGIAVFMVLAFTILIGIFNPNREKSSTAKASS